MMLKLDDRLLHPKTALTGRVRADGQVVQVSNPHGLFWMERTEWKEIHGVKVKPEEMPPGAKRGRPTANSSSTAATN